MQPVGPTPPRRRRDPPPRPAAPEALAAASAAAAASGRAAAALVVDGRAWFALGPTDPVAPRSALLGLIRGVWAAWPAKAHALLRQPIAHAGPIQPFDQALLQVAARRWRAVEPGQALPPGAQALPEAPPPEAWRLEGAPTTDLGWLQRAEAALGPPAAAEDRAVADRPVAALLVDEAGRLVLAARNRAGRDRTRHAEAELASLCWARLGGPPPAGWRLLITLQPCRMCAALWDHLAPQVSGGWLHPDPGRFARGTRWEGRQLTPTSA